VNDYENEVKILDSVDEIEIPEENNIPPINFDGLPEYNLTKQFVNYVSDVSDTYPEYSCTNGLSSLGTITRRRLYFKFNGRKHYTNLFNLNLGISGYPRKSASQSMIKHAMKVAGIEVFLPEDITPEALIEAMSDSTDEVENGEFDVPTVKPIKMPGYIEPIVRPKIPPAQKAIWKDEAGQLYAQMNKPHMQSMKELLCVLYDCPPNYIKKKVSAEAPFILTNPCLNMNLATTPTLFFNNTTQSDINTGFLARHNIVNPSYTKVRKPLTQDGEKDEKMFDALVKAMDNLDYILGENELKIVLSEEFMKLLDEWAEQRENKFRKEHNDAMGSFFARFQINVVKIAILIELGNLPYYISRYVDMHNNNLPDEITINASKMMEESRAQENDFSMNDLNSFLKNDEIKRFKLEKMDVSIESLLFAIKLYDELFIPYTYEIVTKSKIDVYQNHVNIVYNFIRTKKISDYSEALRGCNMKAKDFGEVIDTLFSAGALKIFTVKGKTKNKIYLVYMPQYFKQYTFKPLSTINQVDDVIISLKKKE